MTEQEGPLVHYEVCGAVAVVTMDRQEFRANGAKAGRRSGERLDVWRLRRHR